MINYKILHDSTVYYEQFGFKRIEVPWTVAEYVDKITRPEGVTPFQLIHNNKCLVASAEQSFLYLYLKEYLPLGRWMAITPCFRFEEYDLTHTKTFMKNEIIQTDVVSRDEMLIMVEMCLTFFRKYIPNARKVCTDEGIDIMWNDIELGSYGIRECPYLEWIYGTGVAEPRFSRVIDLYNLSELRK